MWKCFNCGQQFEDRYNHCAYCGTRKTPAVAKEIEEHTPAMPTRMESPQASGGTTEKTTLGLVLSRDEIWSFILKGVGLFLLFQAFIAIPEILSGIYTVWTYSNLISSLSAELAKYGALTQQLNDAYRNLLILPIAKIFFYVGAGIYLIRGGGSLLRLLSRAPKDRYES